LFAISRLGGATFCEKGIDLGCTFEPTGEGEFFIISKEETPGGKIVKLDRYWKDSDRIDMAINIFTLPVSSRMILPSLDVSICEGVPGRNVAYISAGAHLFEFDLEETSRFTFVQRATLPSLMMQIGSLSCLGDGKLLVISKDKKIFHYNHPEEFLAPGQLEEFSIPTTLSTIPSECGVMMGTGSGLIDCPAGGPEAGKTCGDYNCGKKRTCKGDSTGCECKKNQPL
jgi:hypothetical protein